MTNMGMASVRKVHPLFCYLATVKHGSKVFDYSY